MKFYVVEARDNDYYYGDWGAVAYFKSMERAVAFMESQPEFEQEDENVFGPFEYRIKDFSFEDEMED